MPPKAARTQGPPNGTAAPLPQGARQWRSEREPASEAGGRVGVCPGLYDNPHRRSLTGGARSSSRLAPIAPYPIVSVPNLRAGVACIHRVGGSVALAV